MSARGDLVNYLLLSKRYCKILLVKMFGACISYKDKHTDKEIEPFYGDVTSGFVIRFNLHVPMSIDVDTVDTNEIVNNL